MKTVYKYKINNTAVLELPVGAKFLTMTFVQESFTVWFELDPDGPSVLRKFEIFGTGWPIPSEAQYLETYITPSHTSMGAPIPQFVWHLYELPRPL